MTEATQPVQEHTLLHIIWKTVPQVSDSTRLPNDKYSVVILFYIFVRTLFRNFCTLSPRDGPSGAILQLTPLLRQSHSDSEFLGRLLSFQNSLSDNTLNWVPDLGQDNGINLPLYQPIFNVLGSYLIDSALYLSCRLDFLASSSFHSAGRQGCLTQSFRHLITPL